MQNVVMLNLKEFSDKRGSLIPLEFPKSFPFAIKRVYYIYDVKPNEERGFHSHRNLEQILICLGGTVKIRLKDSINEETIVLDKPNKALYIGPMIWREMYEFSQNCTLLVLASNVYDEKDYIKDYNVFVKEASEYLKKMEDINNYTQGNSVNVKLVQEDDVNFLFELRNDSKLNKYISKVSTSIDDQLNWIKSYKIREFNKKEYYFKIINKTSKQDIGFVRLYNIDYNLKQLTFGSFIVNDQKTKYAALESMILMMEISFRYLEMKKVFLDVRKENQHAKDFYNRFGFKKINENDLDEFYELTFDLYEKLFSQKYKSFIGEVNNEN